MSEAQEQRAVVEWCDWQKVPIFHIPNGGSRNVAEAANLKRQGVKAGVPDLCVPLARGKYHGLYIEMKAKNGRLSSKQVDWLVLLSENGYLAKVCYGAQEAISCIKYYLDL